MNPTQFPTNPDNAENPSLEANSQTDGQNWEARFKGLQREFQRLQQSFNAKQEEAVQLKGQLTEAQQMIRETTSGYESKLTEFQSTVQSKTKELETLLSTKAQLEGEVSKLARDREIRKELSKPEYQGLAPWYDSGFLNVDGKEGEELKTHLEGFKQMLSTKSASEMQNLMGSTTPPAVTNQTVRSAGGMNQDELRQWLRNNPSDPNYQNYYNQFLALVSEETKGKP